MSSEYTGRTRYRLRGLFKKVLVLQVEEQITGCCDMSFYMTRYNRWRDATFDDLQNTDQIDRARRKRERER